MKKPKVSGLVGPLPEELRALRPMLRPAAGVTMAAMTKKQTTRKHGYAARAREIGKLLTLEAPARVHEAIQAKPRLRTLVTFEQTCQSYLWITDRGRSRLIKH